MTLALLSALHAAQQQHGLRHGDFARYRRHCARRVQKLRNAARFHHCDDEAARKAKAARFKHGPPPFVRRAFVGERGGFPDGLDGDEMAANASDVAADAGDVAMAGDDMAARVASQRHAHLWMVAYETERAWAYATEYKAAGASAAGAASASSSTDNGPSARHNYHLAVKKLKRAVQYAQALAQLARVDAKGDGKLCMEVEAYAGWMAGTLAFETRKWDAALDELAKV